MAEFLSRAGRRRIAVIAGATIALVVALVAILLSASGGGVETQAESRPDGASPTLPPATSETSPTPEASPTPIVHPGILDGVAMSEAEWAARKDLLPLAVMVDNTAAAYPQAGLNRADIVYEAFVEGGITRLLAVYWRQDAERILPVRSARTPFVTWASELGAMYAHAGGASTENDANALGQIVEWGVRDLNAFADIPSNYYERDPARFGPVDLGTSTAYLREAAERLGFVGPPTVESWRFRGPGVPLTEGEAARGVQVEFNNLYPWQVVQWRWDAERGRYLRFQFGRPHGDALTGEQLAFATVIVMKVPAQVVDEEGHVILEQLGGGEATVFTGGRAYAGTWKKDKRETRTRFYDARDEEIVFERGPVFVEAIGEQSRARFTTNADDLPPLPEYELPPWGTPPFGEPEPSETATPTPQPEPPAATPTVPQPTATPGAPTATPTPTVIPTPTVDPTF